VFGLVHVKFEDFFVAGRTSPQTRGHAYKLYKVIAIPLAEIFSQKEL